MEDIGVAMLTQSRMLYSQEEQKLDFEASKILIFVFSFFNALASLLTLYLIYDMKLKINLYLKLVVWMTIVQTIFDFNLCLYEVRGASRPFWLVVQLIVGVSSGTFGAFLSNILGTIISLIIYSKKSFNDTGYQINISIGVSFLISAVLGIFVSPEVSLRTKLTSFLIYNYFRVASIIYNFLCTAYIYYDIYRVSKNIKGHMIAKTEQPLLILANRMAMYPMVQALARVFITWYQLEYENTIANYNLAANPTGGQRLLLYLTSILTPCAGFGYLVVFLCMQRGAWLHLKCKLLCQSQGEVDYNSRYVISIGTTNNNHGSHTHSGNNKKELIPISEWNEEDLSDEIEQQYRRETQVDLTSDRNSFSEPPINPIIIELSDRTTSFTGSSSKSINADMEEEE